MHAAVIGADGMVGRKLAAQIIAERAVGGDTLTRLTLADVRPAAFPLTDLHVQRVTGDVSEMAVARELVGAAPQVIFHVAATAMGQADSDFAAGYRINFSTLHTTLEAIRLAQLPTAPRLIYASSIGVFGPPFPDVIPDDHQPRPDSSYGTQKLLCEALINDYSRLGIIDGIALRLPTLAIRPGSPTQGNSGFFSNIIREPLAGRRAELPASIDVRHWMASPRSAVRFLLHAAAMPTDLLGRDRVLTMPGLAVSVVEQIAVLREIGGEAAVELLDYSQPPIYAQADFPAAFSADRARRLGFTLEERSFRDIVDVFLAEEAADGRFSRPLGDGGATPQEASLQPLG